MSGALCQCRHGKTTHRSHEYACLDNGCGCLLYVVMPPDQEKRILAEQEHAERKADPQYALALRAVVALERIAYELARRG